MQLEQIKHKYKQILDEPESEDSQEDWSHACSSISRSRPQRVVTESVPSCTFRNLTPPTPPRQSSQEKPLLAVKQQLAQTLAQCKEYSSEVERLKKEKRAHEAAKAEWKEQISELKTTIEDQQQDILHLQDTIRGLQEDSNNLSSQIHQMEVEKDLQAKQTDYYKNELEQARQQVEEKEKQIRNIEKEYRQTFKLKKQNEYLKADIERLSKIIEDSVRVGKISGEIMKKHFLGKPHRELEYWYPSQLIGEVEHFLKKSQVGYGNKDFTANLVKFIERATDKTAQRARTPSSVTKASRVSQSKTKPVRTIDYSLKKSRMGGNDERLSQMRNSCYWKGPTEEARWASSQASCKSSIWDIVTGFRSVLFELLMEKEVRKKKIKKLVDSMCGSIGELFQEPVGRESSAKHDCFGEMRLEMDQVPTTPLK